MDIARAGNHCTPEQLAVESAINSLLPRLWILKAVQNSLNTASQTQMPDPNGWGNYALQIAVDDLIGAVHQQTEGRLTGEEKGEEE